jgi:glycine/D-amino acid oxidase-like deaminating enzyme
MKRSKVVYRKKTQPYICPENNLMQTDYLIVGQGICGTLLSWEIMREGGSVIIVDDENKNTSSRTACGLINPVTGMRYVKSWRFDEFMETAKETYTALGYELGIKLLQEQLLLHFFEDMEEEKRFEERMNKGSEHLYFSTDEEVWKNYFNFQGRVGCVQPCYMLSLPVLIERWRNKMKNEGKLMEASFDFSALRNEEHGVYYKGISAKKIIFCDGVWATKNPLLQFIPFSLNMGEAIILSIEGLPKEYLYMNGYKIAPWRDGKYWIGSTFDWKYEKVAPTKLFRESVENKLHQWLKVPYKIEEHLAAERPSTADYHPFLGLHPQYKNITVFNGQGTKGCSQTPYFAKQMKDFLLHNKPLEKEVDIDRVIKKKT